MGGAIVSVDAKAKQEQLIEFILILKFLLWAAFRHHLGGATPAEGVEDGGSRDPAQVKQRLQHDLPEW